MLFQFFNLSFSLSLTGLLWESLQNKLRCESWLQGQNSIKFWVQNLVSRIWKAPLACSGHLCQWEVNQSIGSKAGTSPVPVSSSLIWILNNISKNYQPHSYCSGIKHSRLTSEKLERETIFSSLLFSSSCFTEGSFSFINDNKTIFLPTVL